MKKATVILFHGVILAFVEVVLVVASRQVDKGNYIVPRTTLELSTNTNKTAGGHKKKCKSNLDCEMYVVNNQCCMTISGYSKCRKKCRTGKKQKHFRTGNKRRLLKSHNKNRKKKTFSMPSDCVGPDKVYKEKERVRQGCTNCICLNGKMDCKSCPAEKCEYNNNLYENGYHLVLHNGCKRCVCRYEKWKCSVHPCEEAKNTVVKPPNSTVSIIPSVLLALICPVIHFLWLT